MMIPYREHSHGDFNEEWAAHHRVNDWWYVTGYLRNADRPGNLYSYQFTMFSPRHFGKTFSVLHLGFTDMQTGEHLFEQKVRLTGKNTAIDQDTVSFLPFSRLQKHAQGISLTAKTKGLELVLDLDPGKGAFWHGDNGVMVMGLPDDLRQRTVYYSYPNMPTSGSVKFTDGSGRRYEFAATGKSWFDRQWGPFRMFNAASYWEWFSIRFFDDEEVMLFAFPQHRYYDGTFIDKDRKARRILDYEYSYHRLNHQRNLAFSYGWDIVLPGIKTEKYRVLPMNEGQYNGRYYELIANVTDTEGNEVGYCFAELLPGIRRGAKKFNILRLLMAR